MAREYGTIETAFWKEPAAKRLSHDAVLLYFYFRSSPHSSSASAYWVPVSYISAELRMPVERVKASINALSLKPFVMYDADAEVVYLPGLLGTKGNKLPNPNVAKSVATALMGLPDCRLKALAVDELVASGAFDKIVKLVVGDWRFNEQQVDLPLSFDHQQPRLFELPAAPPAPPAAPPREKKKKTEGSRLAEDWHAPTEYRDYALSKGLTEEQVDATATKFRRYWTGEDAPNPVKKDWYRTWQNWVDRESERKIPKTNGFSSQSDGATVPNLQGPDWAMREKGFRERGFWLDSWGFNPDDPRYQGGKRRTPPPPT